MRTVILATDIAQNQQPARPVSTASGPASEPTGADRKSKDVRRLFVDLVVGP